MFLAVIGHAIWYITESMIVSRIWQNQLYAIKANVSVVKILFDTLVVASDLGNVTPLGFIELLGEWYGNVCSFVPWLPCLTEYQCLSGSQIVLIDLETCLFYADGESWSPHALSQPLLAMSKPRFFSACCEVCSLLVIYLPGLVIRVLPPAFKITPSFCSAFP